MILVFGGGGQLGCELAVRAGRADKMLKAVSRAEADIADPAAVARAIDAHAPTLIVNAAAYNAVDRAESEPEAAMRANAEGPALVAQAAKRAGVPLVHISTDYVFDGEKGGPYVEDDPVRPLNAYGRSKAAGEAAVRRATPEHFILRTAWLIGVHGHNFLKTMVRLAGERDSLEVVADQIGSPTATADLADAILTLAGRAAGDWGTYHLAGTGVATRHALASAIVAAQARFTGRCPPVRAVSSAERGSAAHRPRNSSLDSTKFARIFGFRAADWHDAVDRTVAELFAGGGRA